MAPSLVDLPTSVTCPHCTSIDTEILAPFGSVLAVAQYYCYGCRTPFEQLK